MAAASRSGDAGEVRELLANGKSGLVDSWEDGYTPLMMASKNGHLEVVQVLIDHRADINLRYAGRKVGRTALDMAKESGHTTIETLLLQAGAQQSSPGKQAN